jgi:glycine oxidase
LSTRSSSFDVAIIGAGAIGLAVGWRAAQRGMRVVVLERDEPGSGTTTVAAGMLAPISEAALTEQALLSLGLESVRIYPSFVSELADASGVDPGYLRCGTLAVARDADEAEALERELALRVGLGLEVERLLASEARRLEPALAPTIRLALDVPGDHAIDPRKLSRALAEATQRAGAELRPGAEVVRVSTPERRIELAQGERIVAEQVVVAAGPWSARFYGAPIHPVKGQILRLHDPTGPGLITRVVRMPGGYLVPRGDGRYVLGATVEERGFDPTVTAGAVFELLRDATELVPGVSELAIDELSAGFRPATPDNAPLIGPGATPWLHWATGHYRNGILLAPITANIVVDALCGSPAPAEFSPQRFANVPAVA